MGGIPSLLASSPALRLKGAAPSQARLRYRKSPCRYYDALDATLMNATLWNYSAGTPSYATMERRIFRSSAMMKYTVP